METPIEFAWFDAAAGIKCVCGELVYIDPGETECECGRVYVMVAHIKEKGKRARAELAGHLPARRV